MLSGVPACPHALMLLGLNLIGMEKAKGSLAMELGWEAPEEPTPN